MEITAINMNPDILKLQTDITSGKDVSGKNNQQAQNDKDTMVKTEDIAEAIKEVNKKLTFHNKRLQFSVHDKTKQIMVKVVDELTGEVIREIPPKKVLDMVAMTWEEIGLLVDEKV
ncbi:MAG TPA: flagellar protein FlaG [Syntrophomonadaceae bacterium]|nr:flagellar protein FlaG [Syntrophomonadaceae bacterium]